MNVQARPHGGAKTIEGWTGKEGNNHLCWLLVIRYSHVITLIYNILSDVKLNFYTLKFMKQTKIVCSISDRHCDVDFLRKLFFSGMNVVRMNTAHASQEGIRQIIRNTRAVSQHLALLIDTKGPEVRTTALDEPIHYKVGDMVKIIGRPEMDTTKDIINVSYPDFARDVKVGDHVLLMTVH